MGGFCSVRCIVQDRKPPRRIHVTFAGNTFPRRRLSRKAVRRTAVAFSSVACLSSRRPLRWIGPSACSLHSQSRTGSFSNAGSDLRPPDFGGVSIVGAQQARDSASAGNSLFVKHRVECDRKKKFRMDQLVRVACQQECPRIFEQRQRAKDLLPG